jgi:hypothetical protein
MIIKVDCELDTSWAEFRVYKMELMLFASLNHVALSNTLLLVGWLSIYSRFK